LEIKFLGDNPGFPPKKFFMAEIFSGGKTFLEFLASRGNFCDRNILEFCFR